MQKDRVGLAAVAAIVAATWAGHTARAQTHAVKKPETVVRAVAVYEFTGDAAKATASRIVPVSLYINGNLQDAGVYLARPVPFALGTGTVYEAQRSGVIDGTLELAYDRHLTSGDTEQIDNGWLAYGPFKPAPKEVAVAPKPSGPLPKVVAAGGSRPHFDSKPAGDDRAGKAAEDKDTPRPDPDRPSFHKSPTPSPSDPASTRTDASDPNDEAERPTLKRRTPAEIKADQKKKNLATVVGGTNLNDDPDRPNLHRGKPAVRMEEEDLPPLRGLPKDMKQLVVVSDAKTRAEHDFGRPWENDTERIEVQEKLRAMAREKLGAAKDVAAPAAPAVAAKTTVPARTTAASRAAAARAKRRAKATPAAIGPELHDEVLKAYTLSYGGDPTYFYTASTSGVNGSLRYVSLVAQQDAITGLKLALASVTESTHLDRTPCMRLVDVVDADASNRASLLMELRAQHSRQFALYRVIGAKAEQVFATGTTE